ncbi:hypothetical protein EVA_11534, partial [gut metagenome]
MAAATPMRGRRDLEPLDGPPGLLAGAQVLDHNLVRQERLVDDDELAPRVVQLERRHPRDGIAPLDDALGHGELPSYVGHP